MLRASGPIFIPKASHYHVIVNKNEDLGQLVSRMMRYGNECEICSPRFLREEMIERINKTLDNYIC